MTNQVERMKHLEGYLHISKKKFDETYTRDPNMSLADKQEAWANFLKSIKLTSGELQSIYDMRDEWLRRIAEMREMELHMDMNRRQPRRKTA